MALGERSSRLERAPRFRIPVIALLSALSASSAAGPGAPVAAVPDSFEGEVRAVASGRCLLVRRGRSLVPVCLKGIFTVAPDHLWGKRARDSVARWVLKKRVKVEPSGRTALDQLEAVITWAAGAKGVREPRGTAAVGSPASPPAGSRLDLRRLLLTEGLAWCDPEVALPAWTREVEDEARQARRGLWSTKGSGPRRSSSRKGEGGAAQAPTAEVCEVDADCYLLPETCPRCPPAEPTWRRAGSKRARDIARAVRARGGCVKPLRACKAEEKVANWRGERAICAGGRCVVEGRDRAREQERLRARHRARRRAKRPPSTWSKHRQCKRNGDCVFAHSPCGLCPPCVPTWRPVSNRAAFAREAARAPKGQVPCAACPECPGGEAQWLGTRPVCIRGQCYAR